MPDRLEAAPLTLTVGAEAPEPQLSVPPHHIPEDVAVLLGGVMADEAAIAAARGARIRNMVNKTARVCDFLPTVLDPTTLQEVTSLVAKSFNAVPMHRRERMGRLGRAITRIANIDPVPDVPADTVIENFLLELGTQVVPSWYRTSRDQIKADNERIRAGNAAQRRLDEGGRAGWLATANLWRPLVEANQSTARQSA